MNRESDFAEINLKIRSKLIPSHSISQKKPLFLVQIQKKKYCKAVCIQILMTCSN